VADAFSPTAQVLQLQGVCKSFNMGLPNEIEILHDISMALGRGEFCAVMGPSGSGKSTLLNIIGLLDRPSQGQLFIGTEDTTQLDDKSLTRLRGNAIGFVFQHHHLLSAFTALENVMMPMMGATGFATDAMQTSATLLLDRVGLKAVCHQPSGSLSGGQQQRVAVARGLAMNPTLLLADEPTGNLDSKSADAVFELLRQVSRDQGTTVLFVTHNPELADRCDNTIQVVDGRILKA
jgi:lipoprotein-releasing system ATP-binding protein